MSNILLQDWNSNHGVPPFDKITPKDFDDSLPISMEKHIEELKTLVKTTEGVEPTFENVIVPLDRSGQLFYKIYSCFENLCSSNGVKDLQSIELKYAAPLASHQNTIYTLPGLFTRINAVYENRFQSNLTTEQLRLVERFHLDFVRAGAKFDKESQQIYSKIVEELAELTTKFSQNLLADESSITIPLTKDELDGLPEDVIAAAQLAAKEANKENKTAYDYVITLSRSLVVPFLTLSTNRALREKAWRLWTRRGELDPARDNLAIAAQILRLRVKQAKMHGYETFANYANADTMAGSPVKVMELLEKVWTPAKESFERERKELQNYLVTEEGGDSSAKIEPWDWRYYAEKVRQKNYNFDDSEAKPYFSLQHMVDAIFDCAYQLFGLTFKLRHDIPSYHPDVKTYEVYETVDGEERLVAVFLHDNYARPFKRSGAWMSEYRAQSKNADPSGRHVIPIIVNNNNFNKGESDATTLLSYDDAVTMFHEFGHGLHGMLSNVTYNRLAGTSVLRDFVELPSQLYEHWLSQPAVLRKHAVHFQTNEPIPDELLTRMTNARKFNEGFGTIEYTACALVDTAIHKLADVDNLNISEFEKEELGRLGMPDGIVMRHRPAHFMRKSK